MQRRTRRSSPLSFVASLFLCLCLSLSPVSVWGVDDCSKCSTDPGSLSPLAPCGSGLQTVYLKNSDCSSSGSSPTARLGTLVTMASTQLMPGSSITCQEFTRQLLCDYVVAATIDRVFSNSFCPLLPLCQSDCKLIKQCQVDQGNVNCNDPALVALDSATPAGSGWSKCTPSGQAGAGKSSTGLAGPAASSTGGVAIAQTWTLAQLTFPQYQAATKTTLAKTVMVYGQNVTDVAVYKGIPYGQVGSVEATTGQFLLAQDWRQPSAASYDQLTALIDSPAGSASNANSLSALGVPSSQLGSNVNFAATSFGNKCRQLVNGTMVGHRRDCLYFNVYTPYFKVSAADYNCTIAATTCVPISRNITVFNEQGNATSVRYTPPPLLPVIVFIHGGNYWTGSGEDVDPTALVRKSATSGAPVVVVTFNYRLGVWGFLAHKDLSLERTEAKQTSGLYALEDQRLLLTVLKDRLLSFGGDVTRITLLGDSSGATMACMHVMSSKSVGLFHKAILQGGACHTVYRTLPTAEAIGARLAAALYQHNPVTYADCASTQDLKPAACLRKSTAGDEEDILTTLAVGLGCDRFLDPYAPTLGPLIDGYIYDNYAANAIVTKTSFVPLLMGTNTMEYASMIGPGMRNITTIGNLTEADLVTQTVALLYDATIANQPLSNGGQTSSGVFVEEGQPAPPTSSVYSPASPLQVTLAGNPQVQDVVTAMVADWWTTTRFTQGAYSGDTNLFHMRYEWASAWLRDITTDPLVLDKIVSLMTSYYSYCPQQRTAFNLWKQQATTELRAANRMYVYRFSYQSSNDTYAAFGAATQGSIMPYVFGTPSPVFNRGVFTALDLEMSAVLQFYWLHFVYTSQPWWPPGSELFPPPTVSGGQLVADWPHFNNPNVAGQTTEQLDGIVMKFARTLTTGQTQLKFSALSSQLSGIESPMIFECAIWSAMEKQVGSNWYYTPRDAQKAGALYEQYNYCQALPPTSYCYPLLGYPLQSDGQMYVNVRGPFMCAADVEHFFLQVPPMIAALNTQSDWWLNGAKFDCGGAAGCHTEPYWGWPALAQNPKLPTTDYPQYIINPCAQTFAFTLCRMFYRPCRPVSIAGNSTQGSNSTTPGTTSSNSTDLLSSSSTGVDSSASSSGGSGSGTVLNINTLSNSIAGYTTKPCGSLCHNFRYRCPIALAQTIFQPVMDHYLPSPLTFDLLFADCTNVEYWAPVLSDSGKNCSVVKAYNGPGSTATLPNDCACYNTTSPLASSWWSKTEEGSGRMPMAPKCAKYNGTVCAGIINYDVYIAPGDDIVAMERRAEFLVPLQRLATVATGCRESFARHTCSSIFLACDPGAQRRASDAFGLTDPPPYDFQVPYPRFPCDLVCTTAQTQCAALFEAAPQSRLLFNCSRIGVFNPLWSECPDPLNPNTATETHSRYLDRVHPWSPPDYPEYNTTYPLREFAFAGTEEDDNGDPPYPRKSAHAVELNISCNDLQKENWDQTRVTIVCPYPMVAPENPKAATYAGGSCAVPCSSILWTPQQWGYGQNFFRTGVVLGFLMISFLFASYCIFPKNRERYNLWMFFASVFCLSLMYFLQIIYTAVTNKDFGCDSNSELNHQSNFGLCTLAGAFFMYFINASVQWWMALSWDFYNSLVRKKKYTKRELRKQRLFMHLFAWGVPVIFVIVAFAEEAVGRTSTLPWCFMIDSTATEVEWGIMWWPLLARLLLGIYFMFRVFWQMYTQGSKVEREGRGNKWEWFRNQIRVILLVLFFCFVFSWLIVYRAYMWYNAAIYEAATHRYLECLIYGGGESCGPKPDTYPESLIWYGVICCVGAQGVACGLFYGWDKPNFRLWIGLFQGKGRDYFTKPDVDAPSRTDKEGGGYRDMFSNYSGKAVVPTAAPVAIEMASSKKLKATKLPPPQQSQSSRRSGPKSPSGTGASSPAAGGSSATASAAPSSASSRLASPRGPTRNHSVAASAVASPSAASAAAGSKPRPSTKGTKVAPGHYQYK